MTNENGYNNEFENNGINNGYNADAVKNPSSDENVEGSVNAEAVNASDNTEHTFEPLEDKSCEGADKVEAQSSDGAFESIAPEDASEAAHGTATTPNYSAATGERTYFGPAPDSQPYGNTYGRSDSSNDPEYSARRQNTDPYSNGNGSYGNNTGGNAPYGNTPYGNRGYGNAPYGNAPYGNPDYSNNAYGAPHQGQTSGIRYDADKKSNDGSYTWNYSAEGSDTVVTKRSTPEREKKSGHGAFIAIVLVFAILATAVVSSFVTFKFVGGDTVPALEGEAEKPIIGQNGNDNNGTENVVTVPAPGASQALTKQQIAEKCKPSSVGIQITVTTQSYFGYTYKSGGVGSGFILTQDGYIATNHHVVDGADSITVQLDDGTKHSAKLVGSDSITDLAVIKIEATGLVPMEIGDSDKMVVGDSVIAIGTPAGIEFAGTVTDGIISAINRGVEISSDRTGAVKTMTLMQTNAAINPGNSGGPLINDKGEVIGINTLKLNSTYEGIGFSIPINSAVTIFNQLITDGKVSDYDSSFVTGNGAIGITKYIEIGEEEAEYYNYPVGIVILALDVDSNAYSAGLRRYDTIVAFEGKPVKTVAELNKLKSSYKAGDEVTLTVSRDGVGEMDISFKLDLMG